MIIWLIDSPGYGGSEIDFIDRASYLVSKGDIFILSCNVNKIFLEALQALEVQVLFKKEGNGLNRLLPSIHFFFTHLWRYKDCSFIFWSHHIDSNRWLQLVVAFLKIRIFIVERLLPRSKVEFRKSRLSIPIKRFISKRSVNNILCGYSQISNYQNLFTAPRCLTIPNSRKVLEIRAAVEGYKEKSIGSKEFIGIKLITIGRLSAQKNHIGIINAFCKLKEKEKYSLIIVGEGELEDELRNYILQRNLTNVYLIGFSPEPVKWLAIADIFILNSHSEGLPGALIEAMAAGVPCIATDIPGNNELVIHEKSGLLVEENSSEALTKALEKLSCNKELCQSLSINAFAHVLSNYSWEREKFLWEELLNKYR